MKGNKAMKKIVATLLLVGLCLSMLPLSAFAVEGVDIKADNLAQAEGVTTISFYSHEDTTDNWSIANINDGDSIETVGGLGNGKAGGYHSKYYQNEADAEDQFVGYNFGKKVTFNTVIITPVMASTFPVDFEIQVSNDGKAWTPVVTKTGYSITSTAGYLPQTFTFDPQTAQYMRLYVTKLGRDSAFFLLKLTEMEVYNLEETDAPVNIAAGKPVSSDSHHEDGPWSLDYFNDGDRVNLCTTKLDYGQFAGYHSNPNTPRDGGANAHAQITIDLGVGSKFNQVVIYPSHELRSVKLLNNAPDDANFPLGVFFPENYEIQVSDDGEHFTAVKTVTNTPKSDAKPVVLDFDTTTARYIRLYMYNITHYIKLTEFEVYNIEPTTDPGETESPTTGSALPALVCIAGIAITLCALVIKRRRYN